MKKMLLLSSLLVLSSTHVVLAQETDNSARIAEIEAEISELEAELKELQGDSNDGEVIGETFTHDLIDITINDVYLTDERDEYSDDEFENVLVVEYTVKNNHDGDHYAGDDFELYASGKKAEYYYLPENQSDVVSAGREIDVRQTFGFDGSADELELEFKDTTSYSDAPPVIIPLSDLETK